MPTHAQQPPSQAPARPKPSPPKQAPLRPNPAWSHLALKPQHDPQNTTSQLVGDASPLRPLSRTYASPRPLPVYNLDTFGPRPAPEAHQGRRNTSTWAKLQGLAGPDKAGTDTFLAALGGVEPQALRANAARLQGRWATLGAGTALPAAVRAPFEHSLGQDLSKVRAHIATGPARAVTATLGVEALATGNHVLFARPPSQRVLGHELAHVTQQDRGPSPAPNRLRTARPGGTLERDAVHAADAALAGRAHRVVPANGEDLALLAPIVWLAIAALVAGVGIGVTAEVAGPSYEENRRRGTARRRDDSFESWAHATWLWVPVGGTATRIWEAESAGERVFNIIMMPIDVLTLGAVGASIGKIANRALWQTAVRRAGQQELSSLAAQGVRAASAAEVQAQARVALEAGQAVIATVGRRNHALVFVKVGEKYYRLTGGALRSMRVVEMASFAPRNINAFRAFGGAAESAAMLREAQLLSNSWRGIGFSFRSCGISASRMAGAGGLELGLSGAQAYLPVTVMGTLAGRGGIVMSQQGARRMIGGTMFNYALLGSMHGSARAVSNVQGTAESLLFQFGPQSIQPGLGVGGSTSMAPSETPLGPGIEVSEAEVLASLQTGGGAPLLIDDFPAAYSGLQMQLAPYAEPGGQTAQAQTMEIVPVYQFVGAATEDLATQAPDEPGQCLDLSAGEPGQCLDLGGGDLGAGEPGLCLDPGASATGTSDPGLNPWEVLRIARQPAFQAGAERLALDLTMAQDSMDVLTRARDYFPFSFASPEARAAAATAMENAGVGGSKLELARLALETSPAG